MFFGGVVCLLLLLFFGEATKIQSFTVTGKNGINKLGKQVRMLCFEEPGLDRVWGRKDLGKWAACSFQERTWARNACSFQERAWARRDMNKKRMQFSRTRLGKKRPGQERTWARNTRSFQERAWARRDVHKSGSGLEHHTPHVHDRVATNAHTVQSWLRPEHLERGVSVDNRTEILSREYTEPTSVFYCTRYQWYLGLCTTVSLI